MSMTINDDDYRRRLEEAIEARDDGDLEESVALFQDALRLKPDDLKGNLELGHTLKRLKRVDEADAVYMSVKDLYPDNADLLYAWADVPVQTSNHAETIRRARIYRAAFPHIKNAVAWLSLAIQFTALTETLRWKEYKELIREQIINTSEHAAAFRVCMWHAADFCLVEEQRVMLGLANPQAWAQLPPEARDNIRLRIELSELNKRLAEEASVRVLSIGQNCLPYMLCGRWGLIPHRDEPEQMTPFDRGAYTKNNAADVIESSFEGFTDRKSFREVQSWERQRMFEHESTKVFFTHERGDYWFENEGERFFSHLAGQIANWNKVSIQGRRLFVFCLCGEGDVATLVEVMDRCLLGPEAHLLVLDVLQNPHNCPSHEYVTYLHLPYPANFAWDNFTQQTSTKGVGFELTAATAVMDELLAFMPKEEASFFKSERRGILRHFASESEWRNNHLNAVVLYEALLRLDAMDSYTALAYARALRSTDRLEDAQHILNRAAQLRPLTCHTQAAWMDGAVAPFDWIAKLKRLKATREAFPPELEPKTWDTLVEELKLLTAHGEWNDALELINDHWLDFAARPNLFKSGLDTLLQLGQLALAQRLVGEALPEARDSLSVDVLSSMQERLDRAEEYRALVERTGAHVLALGQNVLPAMLIARWGLRSEVKRLEEQTPFDAGDFFGDATAKVLEDDCSGLLVRENYKETPAWGGGVVLRHTATGVTFMMHRTSKFGPTEEQRFFSHIDEMVANWTRLKSIGRCIYVYFLVEKADVELLVATAKQHLLRHGSKLLIVDQREQAASTIDEEAVMLVHAPQPKNYIWFSGLGSATPETLDYERKILSPIIDLLQAFDRAEDERMLEPVLKLTEASRLPRRPTVIDRVKRKLSNRLN